MKASGNLRERVLEFLNIEVSLGHGAILTEEEAKHGIPPMKGMDVLSWVTIHLGDIIAEGVLSENSSAELERTPTYVELMKLETAKGVLLKIAAQGTPLAASFGKATAAEMGTLQDIAPAISYVIEHYVENEKSNESAQLATALNKVAQIALQCFGTKKPLFHDSQFRFRHRTIKKETTTSHAKRMTSSSSITRHLKIHGRVQGVSFRAFVTHHANRLGLDGWVRNRRDDTVEALVTGEAGQVEALIALCHEGPTASRVEKVEVTESQETSEKGFRQTATIS